jgi:hypothetical protein
MRSIISLIVLATFLNLSRSESNNQQDIRWLEDEGCSRVGSRLVRNFLNKAVFPRLPFPADQLPTTCQFHPALDRYKQQEGNKTEISRGDIQCNICGKHFRTEFYLDKHMHNMHKDTLQGGTQGVCLADLCPMFGCHNDHQSQFQQLYRSTDQRIINNNNNNNDKKSFNLDETCTSSSLERQQYQCESLMRKCFADLRDKALQKQFKMNICGELQCINGKSIQECVILDYIKLDKTMSCNIMSYCMLWVFTF